MAIYEMHCINNLEKITKRYKEIISSGYYIRSVTYTNNTTLFEMETEEDVFAVKLMFGDR